MLDRIHNAPATECPTIARQVTLLAICTCSSAATFLFLILFGSGFCYAERFTDESEVASNYKYSACHIHVLN